LARLYEQAELYRKALNEYERSLHFNSKEPDLFFALGRTWRKLGLYTDAERWLIKAQEAGYDLLAVQNEFSRVYEGQGRYQEAALAWSQTKGDGKRLFYLAALAHDDTLLGIARERMKTEPVSSDTTRTYENLVQLLARSPQEILAGKTNDPTLQLLLKTQIYEDK
jgi:tetratricopeptide (TPR) repeat protein